MPGSPPSDRRRPALPRPAAFAVASTTLIAVFLSSGTPIPLYNTYRAGDGITDADLALTTVVYLAVTAVSLLVLGRLSDHIGRRPVAIAAVVSSIAGCLVLTQVHALPLLIAGRVLQGLACGVASSAVGAMVIDAAPRRRLQWLPAVITSSAPPFAIPVGALVSGALVEYGPAPRLLSYEVVVVVLAVCVALLLLCPETTHRSARALRSGGALRSLRPRVMVPPGLGRGVVAAGATLVATWSFSGFYQAFAPGLAADYLGTSDALMVAVVFASIVALSPLGGALANRLPAVRAQAFGLAVFLVAVAAVVVFLHAGAIVPFLLASAIAGIAQGAANGGGMRGVLGGVAPDERAGTLATLYLISYGGAAVPGLVSSALSRGIPLPDISTGYAALVAVAAVVAFIAMRPTGRGDAHSRRVVTPCGRATAARRRR